MSTTTESMSGAWPSSRAGPDKRRLGRRAVDHDANRSSDLRLAPPLDDATAAVRMIRARRSVFTRAGTSSVSPNARVPSSCEYVNTPTWSNPMSLTKSARSSHVAFGLPGEADDERRAEGDVGDAAANASEQLVVGLPRARASHPPEDVSRRVLQRQVDVVADLLAFRHRVEHVVGDGRRVEVEQTNPARDRGRRSAGAAAARERRARRDRCRRTSCPARSAAVRARRGPRALRLPRRSNPRSRLR